MTESIGNEEIHTAESPDSAQTPIKNQQVKIILQEIESTLKLRDEIQKQMDGIIDAIAQNQSLFTKASLFWGQRPLWQKIGIGILLIGPTIGLAIAIHLSILAISAFTLLLYLGFSLILDNHHSQNEKVKEDLKESMLSMADALQEVVESLVSLKNDLTKEIEQFQIENENLSLKIIALEKEIKALSHTIETLIIIEKELKATQLHLQESTEILAISVEQHHKLLTINREELNKISLAIESTHQEMNEKIAELHQVKQDLSLEISKAKEASTILHEVVIRLTETVLDNEPHRVLFQNKLADFLSNSEQSFDEVAARIKKAEQELSLVKEELRQSNKRYQLLLEREEAIILQFEQNNDTNSSENEPTPAKVLKRFGLHAINGKTLKDLEFSNQVPACLKI